ncbi:glucosaminidase domain-containing protein [Vibrio sp. SCSIO 43135]|uniref:glucosaminidase domain-containing protein n=1 Tax=Vibrio sp. SCSIO 43135 TaxID=2819096 RepID=UPI002075EBE5|nr:glucosaminidase domain-containing protein [Vibrio sp. SCSIO 43135]USD39883.1 glucosaminidase domain-containing protein [Vibrio sp. SCSIO 43135]
MRKVIGIAAAGLFVGGSLYIAQDYEERYAEEREKKKAAQKLEQVEKPEQPKVVEKAEPVISVDEKKSRFFSALRPGIELENQRVLKERKRLEQIQQHLLDSELNAEDNAYAKRLGKLYRVNVPASGVDGEWVDKMLHRVDVLPEALVLTQAANESAWGTSRFAEQANNYFGQWCYSKGCGLVPLQRSEGMTHEVAKFDSVQQSIHGYFMNVNRNAAYHDLREIRYQRHLAGEDLLSVATATALTDGLLAYSERGQDYVDDLQAMIRHNNKYWTQQ